VRCVIGADYRDVALTLRATLRGAGLEMIEEHWPGPRSSVALILKRAAYPAKS
jgi:hypothetical protein